MQGRWISINKDITMETIKVLVCVCVCVCV